MSVTVRPLAESDLAAADVIMRTAFGTFLGVPEPGHMFGDADYVRTRFRAAPDCAWAAEIDGELVGSNFATRWGSFAFFGPLTVRPDLWGKGIGSSLMEPVLDAFDSWALTQAGLFTFPHSAKHIGLYQKHGFWPRSLNPVMSKEVADSEADSSYFTFSGLSEPGQHSMLDTIRSLTGQLLPGLDLEHEIRAVHSQSLGDTILLTEADELAGIAICHRGPGTEAGSGTCYVKFAAARPGPSAPERFDRLLHSCERHALDARLDRLVAGVNTGRLDAYRRMLARGFHADLVGLAMRSQPNSPDYDRTEHYVLDDLR